MTIDDKDSGERCSTGNRKDGRTSCRNILLAGTALAAASAAASTPSIRTAQAQQPQSAPSGRPPNILVIWADDIGTWNISHNSRGMMGYQDAEHRPHCTRGRVVHRLLRTAELHGRPRGFHRRRCSGAKRHDQGRAAWSRRKVGRPAIRPSQRSSRTRATPPASSARTILATRMRTCRRCTASTSILVVFTTSTLPKSLKISIIRRPGSF